MITISPNHVGIIVSILGLLGTVLGWLFKLYDNRRREERRDLMSKIQEKHEVYERERVETNKSLDKAWIKIDKLVADYVDRSMFESDRHERMASDERLRSKLDSDINLLRQDMNLGFKDLGARLDAFFKMRSNGG